MNAAWMLRDRFPATLNALAGGRIDRAHASVIADAGVHLPDDASRGQFEEQILPVAERETPNRLRPIAQLLAQRIHPVPIDERHRVAAKRRRIWKHADVDGMGEFGMYGPMHTIEAVYSRATALGLTVIEGRAAARKASGGAGGRSTEAGDPETIAGFEDVIGPVEPDRRSLDEIRFDVAADLLLTGHATSVDSAASTPVSASITGRVQITIPALTLLGKSDEPATLIGYGPIALDTARKIAGGAKGWVRVITHPVTGCVLAVDTYRPSAEQRRLLEIRDEHCRFPGCRQQVYQCDLDHTIAAEHGGETDVCNLAHLCRRHHVLKHHSAWKVRQLPGGILEWTAPTGVVVTDRPARTLVFTGRGESSARMPPSPPATPPPASEPPPF